MMTRKTVLIVAIGSRGNVAPTPVSASDYGPLGLSRDDHGLRAVRWPGA
jgi:hypothetical protein